MASMFNFFFKKKNLGLVLGGGSIRGIAHVGVLKSLEHHGVHIDCIAANSAGSIVGALYAAGIAVCDIEDMIMDIDWFSIIRPSFQLKGLFSSNKIAQIIEKNLPIKTFKETNIPLAIVATDLISAKPYVFKKPAESVALAVRASCSIPGVFEPVAYNHMMLVDGLVVNNFPVDVARSLGAQRTIGVNVVPDVDLPFTPRNVLDVLSRVNDIVVLTHYRKESLRADVVLNPLKNYIDPRKTSKEIYRQLIDAGEKEAEKHIHKILKLR